MSNNSIPLEKCQSFKSFLDLYKQRNHMSIEDMNHLINLTSANYHLPEYNTWRPDIQPVKKTEETIIYIDISVNSVDDLLQIVEKYPVKYGAKYNIDLKMLHNIKDELKDLQNMIGIKTLKTAILDQLLYYLQGLHKSSEDYKHTVLIGPPGSGKTEIAKIMGKMYSKMGVIKKPTPPPTEAKNDIASLLCGIKMDDKKYACTAFKKITRADLVAGYVGQTALKTRNIVNECLGGVIFLDEAYSLGNDAGGDTFSKECVDTLCELLSDQKDHLMFIIAGYENEIDERFFSMNSGLESRFVWRFKIDDYTASDLWQIFLGKIHINKGWSLSDDLQKGGEAWFKKNFSSFPALGRDIETLVFKSKIAHSRRIYGNPDKDLKMRLCLDDLTYGLKMMNALNKNKKNMEKQRLYQSLYV
jgi:SpoVK/Ycf46/Vps4 family AAA+-type ATPase